MIDPADKQTKSLPLEQPKRGRGRPSTGAAMTPAEKQKAYRKRMAEQKQSQGEAAEPRKTPAIGKTVMVELDEFDLKNIVHAWDDAKKSALKDPKVKGRLCERVEEFRELYKKMIKR